MFAAQQKPSIAALALAPGDAALDVACGAGEEVRLLAEAVAPGGRAVGLDISEDFLAEPRACLATDAGVEFVVGDAHTMPFDDGQFAGARVERALQHMAEPRTVVAEMARVVSPGRRIVAMEPDWDTIVISSEDRETTTAVVRACADRIRHPDAGRNLAGWFVAAGIELLSIDVVALPIFSLAVAEQVFWLESAVRSIDTAAAGAWLDDLRAKDTRGAFVATGTAFGVVGRVP